MVGRSAGGDTDRGTRATHADGHLPCPGGASGSDSPCKAPRPRELAGTIVGLLDNTKEQGDVILQTVAEVLREQYGVAHIIFRRKDHYSKPAPAALIDAMAHEVQVAVAAVGG